jgi:hypothetical protein
MNLTPVFTAVAIVVAVSFLGLIINYWRQSRLFRDYEDYASDAQALAGRLKAEIFRDGTDLVISGNYGKLPTIVRFSHAENTPGLNVRMRAPATFTMSFVPKSGTKPTDGRVLIRTPDDAFDARFATRTDHPTQARMFVTSKAAFAQIQKLCCSSHTFLTLTSGGVELSELTIPTPYAGKHIQAHLESMAELGKVLQQMPGADAIKITPYQKQRSNVVRAALAVGVLTAIVVVINAVYDHSAAATASAGKALTAKPPEGVPAADAERLGGLQGFRLANGSDFEADAAAWVRSQTGSDIPGRFEAAFSGGQEQGTAYILVKESGVDAGKKRVVVIANNDVQYDAGYAQLALAGKVLHENMAAIPWVGNPPPADGDGLLIVRKGEDLGSGAVIYLSGGRVATAAPSSYLNVRIQ